ncbi:MAG: hypothetical protein ACRDAI_00530 [Candidatus Rhabdochlamydia sp.]
MGWNILTDDISAKAGESYFCSGTTTIKITLPESTTLGDSFSVYAINSSGWVIVQLDGQKARCAQFFSTDGPKGGISSSSACDAITLTYCSDNKVWEATSYQGNVNVY